MNQLLVGMIAFLVVVVSRVTAALQAIGASSSLTECGGPVQLQWTNSVGQTDVRIVDEKGRSVKSFDRQPENTFSVTWYPINATAGQRLFLLTNDTSGQKSTSEVMVVGSGSISALCQPMDDAALPSFTLFSGAPVETATKSETTSFVEATSATNEATSASSTIAPTISTNASSTTVQTTSTGSSDTGSLTAPTNGNANGAIRNGPSRWLVLACRYL